jgi:hypothetical protein
MTIDIQTLSILAVIFAASFIRSAFGFGDALIAMPLLAIIVGIKTATPLVAMIATTITVTILLRHWREARLGIAWRLIISSFIGIPLGLLFLKNSHDVIIKLILSVTILSFSIYALTKPRVLYLKTEKSSYLFGFIAGILGGAYNTNGPPVVVYGSLRRWPPNTFKATIQGYFLPIGLMILVGHYTAGLWTRPVLQLYALSLPVVLLAILVGGRLGRSIPEGKFDRFVHTLLIAIGILLMVQTVGTFMPPV